MPALKEGAWACIQDERASRLHRRTEFRKPNSRGRRELERRRADQGCKLGVKPLLRCLVNERERGARKAVYKESGCQKSERKHGNGY